MFRNYLKTAFRHLLRHRLYSFINLFGLSLGLAVVVLIVLFIRHEFSFDRFHSKAERIVRVEEIDYEKSGVQLRHDWLGYPVETEGIGRFAYLPLGLGPKLKEEFPEVQRYTRYDSGSGIVRKDNKSFTEELDFVDSAFFEVFSFPLLAGDPRQVLREPNSVVLTPELALKYFGREDPIGETLSIQTFDTLKLYTVSGVVQRPPSNSSLDFKLLLRIENRPFYQDQLSRWSAFNTPLFLELSSGVSPGGFQAKLEAFTGRQFKDMIARMRVQNKIPESEPAFGLTLTALQHIHFDSSVSWDRPGSATNVLILGGIALLILLIAALNYISLSLASASGRMQEVGVRKVLGSTPRQISRQFWVEAQLLVLIAVLGAVALVEIFLPVFNNFVQRELSLGWTGWLAMAGPLLGITFIAGLLSGAYPAQVLARFRPSLVLKSNNTYRYQPGFIKGAVLVQFSLSVFLLLSSLIMYRQMRYVNEKDLGYDQEQVVVLPTNTGWNDEGQRILNRLRQQLRNDPQILSLTGTDNSFGKGWNINDYGTPDGKTHSVFIYYGDADYLPTLGIELLEGRNFSPQHPSDTSEAVIINEAMVRDLGLSDPVGAIAPWREGSNRTIIGVVKDFHFLPLTQSIQPALINMNPQEGKVTTILAKIKPGNTSGALLSLEQAWRQAAPSYPFEYTFLDDDLAAEYESFQRWMSIMGVATGFAVLIACLGLFGLAGILAINKTREIGIRKVLGASMADILLLLNRDLLRLSLFALLLAAPLSYFLMQRWLARFEYHISPGWQLFVAAGLLCLTLALLTVSYHSFRAARRNPADTLKAD